MTPYPTVAVVTAADLANEPDAFPSLPGKDFIVSKSPAWNTSIRRSKSHREVRVSNMASPEWTFRLRHNVLRDKAATPELAEILAFFNSRLGRFGFMYFQDPTDYQATNQGFGTGNGTETLFQLRRTINIGGVRTSLEPVYAPWLAPVIMANGVVVSAATYTLSTWGRVTFNTPPANAAVLTWTGKFLYVCRFDQDEMELEQLAEQLWSQQGLVLKSIRP